MLPGIASAIVGSRGRGAIQFVGGAVASKVGATSGTSTIALNSGLAGGIASSVSDGDIVIAAFCAAIDTDYTLSITDGSSDYTLIGSELFAYSLAGVNLRVAYKFVSGDTATTFGPTQNTSAAGTMAVYVFRNVDQSTPLDVAATTATSGTSVLADPPSITPSTPGAYIVCVGGGSHSEVTQTFTSSDLTDFLTVGQSESTDGTIGIGHKPDWTSGAFDAAAFGFTGSDNAVYAWAALSLALRPA